MNSQIDINSNSFFLGVMHDHLLWIEKYRPQDFSDIKGQQDVVLKVKAFVEKQNMPHLLFAGPAGIGKTSLSLVIAKKTFGDNWRQNFLELNASDERGIDVVRVKVKDFARTRAIGDVPYKIIYLDEADALTREAQQALRRTMENYTQTCRFILSCNYPSKIIEPIQSRCAVFRFKPLAKEDVFALIEKIAAAEQISVDAQAAQALYEISLGDCRQVENVLQAAASTADKITAEVIYTMASIARPKEVQAILKTALSGKFLDARSQLLELMLNNSLAGLDVIKQIQKEIINLAVGNREKMMLIDKCGEIEFRMTEGSDEFVQLEALLSQFVLAGEQEREKTAK